MLRRLANAGFMINVSKTKFMVTSAKILGHELRPGYIKPNYKKLDGLLTDKKPTSFKDLQHVFGLLSYFR